MRFAEIKHIVTHTEYFLPLNTEKEGGAFLEVILRKPIRKKCSYLTPNSDCMQLTGGGG
jgi:hypothetical protein